MLTVTDAFGHEEEIRELFLEYTQMLVDNDSRFAEYLVLQNYDDEFAHLEHKYGKPAGRLYVAHCDGALAGCIALRKLDEHTCELKRLYVRPQFRGRHFGKMLTEKIIADAKEIGYSALYLDTLPFLKTAIKMYRDMGFYDIPCYNNSPIDDTVFLKLDL